MNVSNPSIEITLRIPGNWSHPSELLERLPEEYRLTEDSLLMPDGTSVEFDLVPPDEQFAEIFKSSCRRPATADELAIVDNYTVNFALTRQGGSMVAARAMMQAGAAIVRAGGGGVFIDNSALSHGGSQWLAMTEDGGTDALSFAFAGIISSQTDVWTMGMHVLGLPDVRMRRDDVDPDGSQMIEMIHYLCTSDHPIEDGHLLADENGPRFQVEATTNMDFERDSPMHSPFGQLRLVSMKEIADRN
jgi:hypothetical protein